MDLNINKTFNYLTILDVEWRQTASKKRKYYKCKCKCGNVISIRADNVLNNHTQSCGCLKQEQAKANGKMRIKDLTNQKFGKLTALQIDPNQKPGKKIKWICQCDCGNIVSVYSTNLIRLHTTSCGCVTSSIGENNIEKLLKENNIKYQKEFSFDDLKFKKKLRFDFAIFDKNDELIELIEFDGRQHNNDYTPWNSKETLLERQQRDNLKNNYCKINNIKLIRINYEKRDNITLKDLELII